MKKLIVITGPTATGKTALAVKLAVELDAEIISADSRQVYRSMNLGTGKDLEEYHQNNTKIPYHLIDIRDAGEVYDGFHFQRDFFKTYEAILSRKKVPILCGGTGMYIQLALDKTPLLKVEPNVELRRSLEKQSQGDLVERLMTYPEQVHNSTDLKDRERTIRAIEIAHFKQNYRGQWPENPVSDYLIFVTRMQRETLRRKIRLRLDQRLEEGMIDEVQQLKAAGLNSETLNYYGLEYRFINQYLEKEMTYDDMYTGLLQAIRRFAKKQVTWFRRMERQGYLLHYLEEEMTQPEKVEFMLNKYRNV